MMDAPIELIGRTFGQRGFAEQLRQIGAAGIKPELTAGQAEAIDICVNDDTMSFFIRQVFARWEELKVEHNLSAKPWLDDV